jgi:hypothetical protein
MLWILLKDKYGSDVVENNYLSGNKYASKKNIRNHRIQFPNNSSSKTILNRLFARMDRTQ